MKKWILAILLLVPVLGKAQVTNKTIYNIEPFVRACMDELKVDSANITILSIRPATIWGLRGLTKRVSDHHYIIYVDYVAQFETTMKIVAHEMVHVRQLEAGELNSNNGDVWFEGAMYAEDTNSHYYSPHEVEARERGKELYDEFKTVYLNQICYGD